MSEQQTDNQIAFSREELAIWFAFLSLVAYVASFPCPVMHSYRGFTAFFVGFFSVFDDWNPVWLANPLYWFSLYLMTKRPARAATVELCAFCLGSIPLFMWRIDEMEQLQVGYYVWLLSFCLQLSACVILLSGQIWAWLEAHHLWSKKHKTLALLLMIGMIAVMVVAAQIPAKRLHQRREAITAIEAMHGTLTYEPFYARPTSRFQWLASRIYGADILQHVVSVNMGGAEARISDSDLRHLQKLEQLERLSFDNLEISGAGTKMLAGMSNLTNLTIRNSTVEHGALGTLRGVPNLRELTLSHVAIEERQLHEIASLTNVRIQLDLTSSTLSSGAMSALTKADNIHSLHVHKTNVPDKAWTKLGRLRGLSILSFDEVELSGEAFAAIQRQENLCCLRLRKVRTSGNAWTQLGTNAKLSQLSFSQMELPKTAFAAIQRQTHLRVLRMNEIRVADNAWKELVFIPQLEEVLLNKMRVSGTGLEAIGRQTRLHYLNMNDSTFADDEFKSVFQLKNLKTLALHRTEITTADLRRINELPHLTRLELHATKVSDELCDSLRKLTNLKILTLTKTLVTPQAVERLRTNLPNCKVQY